MTRSIQTYHSYVLNGHEFRVSDSVLGQCQSLIVVLRQTCGFLSRYASELDVLLGVSTSSTTVTSESDATLGVTSASDSSETSKTFKRESDSEESDSGSDLRDSVERIRCGIRRRL